MLPLQLKRYVSNQSFFNRNAEKDEMIYNMMREWERQGFDAIISCAFPLPAIAPKYCSSVVPGNIKQKTF